MKLVTTKAKNIFDENFLTNFLTQFKDLHVQTSKGKTNRNCHTAQLYLEQICSIYIHVCANGKQIGLVVVERNIFNITFRVAPHRAIFALFHFFLDAKLFF